MFILFFSVTVLNDIHARNEINMLQYSHQSNPYNRRVHQSYAVALNRSGSYQKAEMEFRNLLESNPEDVRAYIGLGRVFCDQKRLPECIDQFQQAVFFSDNDPGLTADLKQLYGYFINETIPRIEEGVEDAQLYFQLGIAYRYNGEIQ